MFKKSEHINIPVNTDLFMIENIFSGKSSKIIRVLLSRSSEAWRTRELASEANVSLGLVSIVTNKLIDMGFLVRDKSMRLKLRKEEELLKRWAAVYDLNKWSHRAYYAQGTLYELGTKLAETAKRNNLKYAFTGPFATDLLTHYIRSAEIHMYVTDEEAVRKIVNDLNLEIAEIGGNIIFLIAEDDLIFYGSRKITDNRVGYISIVSDIQLILDLYNYTDRAREAAERLLTKELAKKTEYTDLVKLAREYFERKGLIFEELPITTSDRRPDLVLFDPKTKSYMVVECKNSTAKIDAVDQLKSSVAFFGDNAKGVLIAPSITDAARKELKKANLEFKSLGVLEHGIHKRTS